MIQSKGVLWDKSHDKLWVPLGHDDHRAWSREHTEAEKGPSVTVVEWYEGQRDWDRSRLRGLERKSMTLVNVNAGRSSSGGD